MHVHRVCEYCTVTVLQRETEQLWILLSKPISWGENKSSLGIHATPYHMPFFFFEASWEKEMPSYNFHTNIPSLKFLYNKWLEILANNKIFFNIFWFLLSVGYSWHWHSSADRIISQVQILVYFRWRTFQRGYTLIIVCQWWKYWNTTSTPN